MPKEKYNIVSSWTRSAFLFGRCSSGIFAQLLTSFEVLNLKELNYFALSSLSVASIISLFLPKVHKSIYFNPDEDLNNLGVKIVNQNEKVSVRKVLFSHLKVAYTNPYVVKWSFWVAFATCGYFQVGNYIQALWKYIQIEQEPDNFNGVVEASATLIGK